MSATMEVRTAGSRWSSHRGLHYDERLQELHPTTRSARSIAEELGCTTRQVQDRFAVLGLSKRTWVTHGVSARELTPSEIKTVMQRRADGIRLAIIAAELGMNRQRLGEAMQRAGIPATLPQGRQRAHDAYSKARTELFAHHWQIGTARRVIVAMLNALPGPPIASSGLSAAAKVRGLNRPKRRIAGPRLPRAPVVWTEQRVAVITAAWQAGETSDAILAALNALPGMRIGLGALITRVRYLKLHRPARVAAPPAPKPKPKPQPKRPAGWNRAAPAAPVINVATQHAVTGTALAQDQPSGRIGGFRYDKPVAAAPIRVAVDPNAPVVLPLPGSDGRIEIELLPLMRWCKQNQIEGFDGSNVDALNKVMALRKLPAVVVVWP